MNYFVANFKQNLNTNSAKDWIDKFKPSKKQDSTIILAPTFPHLPIFQKTNLPLAAQNISDQPSGSHTGQVGIEQLKDLIQYCILGHSETRIELEETDKEIAQKTKLLLDSNITPILCLDLSYLDSQITALKQKLPEIKDLLIAYEPASSISTNKGAKPSDPAAANEIASKIKTLTNNPNIPILYGGSVNSKNVSSFLKQESINGVLVGGASLNPLEFVKITNSD